MMAGVATPTHHGQRAAILNGICQNVAGALQAAAVATSATACAHLAGGASTIAANFKDIAAQLSGIAAPQYDAFAAMPPAMVTCAIAAGQPQYRSVVCASSKSFLNKGKQGGAAFCQKSCGFCTSPVKAVDNEGKVTFDATKLHPGLYSTGFIISSGSASSGLDILVSVDKADGGVAFTETGIAPYTGGDSGHTKYTGFNIGFTVKAEGQSAGNRVGFTWNALPAGATLSVIDGTGLPSGADGHNDAVMSFSWTPTKSQAGTHYICVDAVDARAPDSGPGSSTYNMNDGGYATTQHCYELNVLDDSSAAKPTFTGNYESHYTAYINQPLDIEVTVHDENPADSLVIAADGSDGGQCGEAGDWPAGAGWAGAQTGSGADVSRTFRWVPKSNQGGWSGEVCVKATDAASGTADKAKKCFKITVAKCRYAVGDEQMIQQVAAVYDTNWISLFQLNDGVKHPDYLLHSSQEPLWSGNLYKVQLHDNLHDVAARVGTSVEHILTLNADICDKTDIKVNDRVCVHANPCEGATGAYGEHGALSRNGVNGA
jgi:hypothetical protein